MMDKKVYKAYVDILCEELVPAMGCTEPIAVALAGAYARKALGCMPESVELFVSGNIIKNVKSVVVPNTGMRRGMPVAVAAGICYGNPDRELEVISDVTEQDLENLEKFLEDIPISVYKADSLSVFDILVRVYAKDETASVRIAGNHTNVVLISKNNEIMFDSGYVEETATIPENRALLNVKDIVEFADCVDISDVREVLDRQIDYNMAIAKAGMEESYGGEIGKILLSSYGISVHNRAKAWAAAGSDARMNGCELPVVINSGSGNQGITASVPVIVYARELNVSHADLCRALVVSNLVTIHLKTGIGCLSAYCGATSAGTGAGAGICYLHGGKYTEIAHTIVNALAINSGMICDGAKSSCAAKIASAVEAGLLGWRMFSEGSQFYSGEGIVIKGVENTIKAVSKLARDGMQSTDAEIIKLMLQ